MIWDFILVVICLASGHFWYKWQHRFDNDAPTPYCPFCGSKDTYTRDHTLHGFSTNTTITRECSACPISRFNFDIPGNAVAEMYNAETGEKLEMCYSANDRWDEMMLNREGK